MDIFLMKRSEIHKNSVTLAFLTVVYNYGRKSHYFPIGYTHTLGDR